MRILAYFCPLAQILLMNLQGKMLDTACLRKKAKNFRLDKCRLFC